MKTRSPVAFGLIALVLAALWYDSTIAASSAPETKPAAPVRAGMALAR
jgi:hypothetical protein